MLFRKQIQAVIDENLMPKLVEKTEHPDLGIRKEAVFALANAAVGADPNLFSYFIDQV